MCPFQRDRVDNRKQGKSQTRKIHEELMCACEQHNVELECRLRGKLGEMYRIVGEFLKSFSEQKNSLKLARRLGDRKLEVVAMIRFGTTLYYMGFFAQPPIRANPNLSTFLLRLPIDLSLMRNG